MKASQIYDLFVIGGGSGGLAAAKEAAQFGAKVAIADFVKPSPIGTKWGLGGTCVNVGCIPKKLMHFAALQGEAHESQKHMGWTEIKDSYPHSWEALVEHVQSHIKRTNWGYKVELNQNNVKYYNCLASIHDKNTVQLINRNGEKEFVEAKNILISVGGRPTYLNIQGAEQLTVTSDDIFSQQTPPGKTLVVGASYIALETAGFLAGFGYDVTVMVRSILLRGFDQEFAGRIGDYMSKHGVKFINEAVPFNIEATADGKKKVQWKNPKDQSSTSEDIYDTVMLAIGRSADTKNLGLENVGIKTKENGKLVCNDDDTTGVEGIYAIGDCVDKRPELTPAAIKAGRLLSRRLFNNEKKQMDYKYTPTTVFTPLEYSTCGYNEEDAIAKFGEENVKIYLSMFKPLDWSFSESKYSDRGFTKLIVNKADSERVIGIHFLGPNAGEVMQGYAVALKCGVTKQQFEDTIGIHPTSAQEFINIKHVKGTGELKEFNCCG